MEIDGMKYSGYNDNILCQQKHSANVIFCVIFTQLHSFWAVKNDEDIN